MRYANIRGSNHLQTIGDVTLAEICQASWGKFDFAVVVRTAELYGAKVVGEPVETTFDNCGVCDNKPGNQHYLVPLRFKIKEEADG